MENCNRSVLNNGCEISLGSTGATGPIGATGPTGATGSQGPITQITNLLTSGVTGAVLDNGSNIIVDNNPTLGNLNVAGLVSSGAISGPIIIATNSLSTQALEANTFIITSPLDINNTETNFLVRDSATGSVDVRELNSMPFLTIPVLENFDFSSSNYVLGDPDVTVYFIKVGRQVTMQVTIPNVSSGLNTNYITLLSPPSLPDSLKPISYVTQSVTVLDGIWKHGILKMSPSGVIYVGLYPTTVSVNPDDFTNGLNRGMQSAFFSYIGKP